MRIYGQWAGDPKGRKEDLKNCIVEVMENQTSIFYQCYRKRGFGKDDLFCKQYARMYPDGKGIYIPEDKSN